ncbi:MAG: toll/interleukin-1 receptor domain-containing protein, partial [Anaerolineae bacterium]|nr:toll/interleukin-1 receptor domain-containing protein [Anaerolineae bacterium]
MDQEQQGKTKIPRELILAGAAAGIEVLKNPTVENDAKFETIIQQALIAERKAELENRAETEARQRATAASVLRGKQATGSYDVFVAYIGAELSDVLEISEMLKQRGILPWIDVEQPPPARWFEDVIDAHIPNVKSVALVVGSRGQRVWQSEGLQAFLSRCNEKGIRVIPVLLPGVAEPTEVPPLLSGLRWMKLESLKEDAETLNKLIQE